VPGVVPGRALPRQGTTPITLRVCGPNLSRPAPVGGSVPVRDAQRVAPVGRELPRGRAGSGDRGGVVADVAFEGEGAAEGLDATVPVRPGLGRCRDVAGGHAVLPGAGHLDRSIVSLWMWIPMLEPVGTTDTVGATVSGPSDPHTSTLVRYGNEWVFLFAHATGS